MRVNMFRKSIRPVYEKMVRKIPNREAFFRVAELGTFPAAGIVNEATGIIYEDMSTPFFKDVYPFKWGVGFAVATEVLERDLYKIFNDNGPRMGTAINKAIGYDITSFMNLATTGALTTPDGVTLASTAHLYQNGFYSNILSNNAPLTAASLEQAMQEIFNQPMHDGYPFEFEGPFDLWVAPQQMMLAERLVSTKNGRLPEGNYNDDNVAGPRIRRVVTSALFTSPFAWALVETNPEFFPFWMIEGRKVKIRNQYDGDKDAEKFNATAIWSKVMRDPRGFIYSAGQ